MAAVTETAPFSGQNVLTNTVHNAAKGTSSGLVKAAQSGAFARPQLTSNKASNRRSLKLVLKPLITAQVNYMRLLIVLHRLY